MSKEHWRREAIYICWYLNFCSCEVVFYEVVVMKLSLVKVEKESGFYDSSLAPEYADITADRPWGGVYLSAGQSELHSNRRYLVLEILY